MSSLNIDTQHNSLCVLIVEDEIDICYLLSGILKKKNLNTHVVNSLFEAEKEIYLKTPDIIFIDNHLPDGFGIDFISKIKNNNPGTKVIMITAYDTCEDESKALKQGADYFIGKPFSTRIITDTIDNLLQAV